MSTSKKITCQYFSITAAENNYFDNLYNVLQTSTDGAFEAGNLKYAWEMIEEVSIDEPCFLLSLAKEKLLWPVWVTDEGRQAELSLDGTLNDVSYALVCPSRGWVVSCGSAAAIKKLLGQFSPEGVVRLAPYFEDGIDEKVLGWDCYKKVSFSLDIPNDDTAFVETDTGQLTKIIGHLGGLKADITVAAGGSKDLLSNMMVKSLLPELLENDFCQSLIVRGSDFENGSQEQYDLKNAQIKHKEQLEIEGKYITASDMKQLLLRSVHERHSMLFGGL